MTINKDFEEIKRFYLCCFCPVSMTQHVSCLCVSRISLCDDVTVWCSPGYDYSTCKIYPVLPQNGMCCFSVYLAKRTVATRAVLPNVCSVLVLPWGRLLKHQQELPTTLMHQLELPSPTCVCHVMT